MSEDVKLGRFGHHPDPATDFCVECEEIGGVDCDLQLARIAFERRMHNAMMFTVGGDEISVKAKARLREIEARYRPAAPASPMQGEAEPVAVKPLEWNPFIANTPFGTYSVDEDGKGGFWVSGIRGAVHRHLSPCSLTEARAHAQADYDQRIRSALYTRPQPSAEAQDRIAVLKIIQEHSGESWIKADGVDLPQLVKSHLKVIDASREEIERQANDYKDRIAELEKENAKLRMTLKEGRRAIGNHSAPFDCYATGPMTGDPIRDLVQCPACSFIAMYDDALQPGEK